MAADVALDPQPGNTCCLELKKRYLKLEEKRNALRQAVKLLENQTNKLQDQNDALKKVCEEEHAQADLAQQAKKRELDIKNILEKEIKDLKSEIALLQENGNLRNQERNQMLETRIFQGEAEIKRLEELLQKEMKRGDSEKKKSMEEKKKAAEAWKLVKIEKSKAEEEKKIADMEREKAEDLRHCLVKSKSEVSELREKLIEERSKADAGMTKLELEKQKVNKEKKRADSERVKVEEQMKLVEMARGKWMDEKNCADRLSHQLKEERQKREELQKKMDKILSTSQGEKNHFRSSKTKQISNSNEDTASANMKLLKNKLKLQRHELKHAKRMAKLEKAEKRLLLQQLCLLKEDNVQFSRRLEMIVSCFSYDMEDTNSLAMMGGSLKQWASKTQRAFLCSEHEFNSHIETRKTKNNCSTMEYLDPIIPCTWRLQQKCGRRSTKPISGISSDLESPVGDPVRDKSQNSAICSTAVTSSDAQLMGSQGRSAFAVATSAKLAKDNLQVPPSLTGEESKKLYVVEQNNDRIVFHREMECLNPNVHNQMEVPRRSSQCKRGKRRHHGILNAVLSDELGTKNHEFCLKKKSIKRQKHDLRTSDDQIDIHNDVYGYERDGQSDARFVSQDDTRGHAVTCGNASSDLAMNEKVTSIRSENMTPEDFMKLLNLDDDSDEERYQAARALPLSPSLPELEPPNWRNSDDGYYSFTYGEHDGRCETDKEKLESIIKSSGPCYHSEHPSPEQLAYSLIHGKVNPGDTSGEIDRASESKFSAECSQLLLDHCVCVDSGDADAVMNEMSHELIACQASDLGLTKNRIVCGIEEPSNQVVSEHTSLGNIVEKKVAMHQENGFSVDKVVPQTVVSSECRSSMKMETVKQMSLSKSEESKHLCGENGHEHRGVHGFCVVFSNVNDEQIIFRIFSASNAIMHDTSWACEAGFLVATVLHALAAKVDLSAEEKVCILLSLLLSKISTMIPVESAVCIGGDLLSSESDLCIAEMDKVISDEETRSLFVDTCQLDILISLAQDFLTARKIMICGERLYESSDLCTPDNVRHLDKGTRTWTLRTASINQLVAACIILASVSTVLDRLDILWQTSFQLLQRCRGDSYWILTAVHVFASICGMKFSSPANRNLIVTAITSLVLLLEKGGESSGVVSNGKKGPIFSPCVECPFADGELSVDQVASWLLGELQTSTAHAARHLDPKNLVNSSYNTLKECIKKSDGCDACKIQFDGLSPEVNGFCSLHKSVHQLDQSGDTGFCHFADIVSLVELLGYYMGWETVHRKIIQQLFTFLEAYPSSAFAISLLVLVGQLGRIGIEAGDCDERTAEGLMHSLSTFLNLKGTRKSSLPIQFAAVDALLNLLSLDFREVVNDSYSISLEASQVVHVKHIQRWFHQLGEEQSAVSLRLLQKSDMKES